MTKVKYNSQIKDYQKRVERGMAYLDKYKPGWEQMIDLKKLDLSNSKVCMTGQLYGDYMLFMDEKNMTEKIAYSLGFYDRTDDFDDPLGDYDSHTNYDLLTSLWYWAIKFRLDCGEGKKEVAAIAKKAMKPKAKKPRHG